MKRYIQTLASVVVYPFIYALWVGVTLATWIIDPIDRWLGIEERKRIRPNMKRDLPLVTVFFVWLLGLYIATA